MTSTLYNGVIKRFLLYELSISFERVMRKTKFDIIFNVKLHSLDASPHNLTDSRPFNTFAKMVFFMRVTNFIYELNGIAPTWLPKSHSPTAIKATKSWIYSYNTSVFFFVFHFVPWLKFQAAFFGVDFICNRFVVLVSFSNRFCCRIIFSIRLELFNTLSIHFIMPERRQKKEVSQNPHGKIEFCIGCYGIFVHAEICYMLKNVSSVWISMGWSAHNDQSTKEYSTERDEVH